MNFKVIATACLILCISIPGFAAEIFPYQSDWSYKQVSATDALVNEFYLDGFDSSSWAVGPGAFGTGSGCPIQSNVQTTWTVNTDFLLIRNFEYTLPYQARIFYAVDNGITIYINGVLFQSHNSGGCINLDHYQFDIPMNLLVEGTNEIAVHTHDYGSETFFDMKMEDDAAPIPTQKLSWDMVKSNYK